MAEMTTCIPAPPSPWCPSFILCEARTVDPTHTPWGSSSALGPPCTSLSLLCPAGLAGVWPAHFPTGPEASQWHPLTAHPSPTPVTARVQHTVVAQSMLIEMSWVD